MINNVNTDWGGPTYTEFKSHPCRMVRSWRTTFANDPGDEWNKRRSESCQSSTAAGITVVVIGNDGTNRVPSPGSADGNNRWFRR